LSKLGFQNQFLDASSGYSGVSRTNIQGLARNGVLYDNGGKQPEITLEQLFAIYENPASINCPMCPIIAAIVAIVGAIMGAIGGAVDKGNKAEAKAREIDTALTDTARLSRLGPSLMPEQGDFTPTLGGGGGNNNNTGTSSISPGLVLGGLAAGALLLRKKKGKKKKVTN
jgi:hypothetical protein